MPNGSRVRANNVYGVTLDNPLTPSASTFNSVSLPLLPVVASAHAIIVFDPKRFYGDPEIVVVTAHTASSTVATILRGQYGTSQRQHPQGTSWAHVPVTDDWIQILTSVTRPSDPYRGQSIFETDTNRYISRSTADVWQQTGLFFDPPACRVSNNAAQSIPNVTQTNLAFNTELYDTASMHDTVTANTRITITTPGLYLVTGHISWALNTTGFRVSYLVKNGTVHMARQSENARSDGFSEDSVATVYKFIAGDYIEFAVYQNSGGALLTLQGTDFSPEFSATWIGRGN